MRLAYFLKEEWEKDFVVKNLPDVTVDFYSGPIAETEFVQPEAVDALSVFVDNPVTTDVLAKLPKLKLIAARSTGLDHIDLAAAKARGITISSVPSYGENTVAEYAFALILALSRKLYPAMDRIKEEGDFSLEGLRGFDLKGKTIGVIGTGRIGRHVIKMAKGFEMTVVAYEVKPDQTLASDLGFTYLSLPELLGQSDVITLHVPMLPSTKHLINSTNIEQIKKGAILVNTSRGGVVETLALVAALETERLSGAALDVLEEESETKDELNYLVKGHPDGAALKTVLANHVLIDQPNVIITPHNAFNTTEAMERILTTTVDNIKSFIAGTASNVVASI